MLLRDRLKLFVMKTLSKLLSCIFKDLLTPKFLTNFEEFEFILTYFDPIQSTIDG
jgi:hypothetical protein